jgi:3-hydroxyisobutyrate dehydrogenase-like beta-hydroxyacid dehydrogenase
VQTVGVIGLGLMGGALAERFVGGGLRVVGYDMSEDARRRLAELGGEAKASAREVFAAVDVVLLSLPNSDVVAAVVNECRDMLPGVRIIDTTTGDPDQTAALGCNLAGQGAEYLDATLIGSSRVARAGELVVTAGGDVEVYRQCESLFRHFAQQWFHVGPWGSGARMKLVVNLVFGLHRAVLAEALALAGKCGLDRPTTLDVLRSGGTYSRVMDIKGRRMIDGDFTPDAKLDQHLKDVRLILAESERVGGAVPLSEVHERLLAGLVERGFGGCDNSAVIRAFDAGAAP